MKTKSILIVIIFGILISSCTVLSFYPLYTKDKLIKDDRIIGQWQSVFHASTGPVGPSVKDTIIWNISFNDKIWRKPLNNPFDRGDKQILNQYTYTLNVYHKDKPADSAEFHLHLVKLGDKIYLDFFPEEWNKNNDILAVHLMYVHTFAKITINNQLEIQWFDSGWLQQMFDENKIRIKHENNGVYTLLTAKPKELQQFIIKYSDDKEAFSEDMNYTLKKI
jgi:hypothetical protein